jgi:hypothetical protein
MGEMNLKDEAVTIGGIAVGTVSRIREVLFHYAEENEGFKRFMLGRESPDDAECVQWLVDRLKERG